MAMAAIVVTSVFELLPVQADRRAQPETFDIAAVGRKHLTHQCFSCGLILPGQIHLSERYFRARGFLSGQLAAADQVFQQFLAGVEISLGEIELRQCDLIGEYFSAGGDARDQFFPGGRNALLSAQDLHQLQSGSGIILVFGHRSP